MATASARRLLSQPAARTRYFFIMSIFCWVSGGTWILRSGRGFWDRTTAALYPGLLPFEPLQEAHFLEATKIIVPVFNRSQELSHFRGQAGFGNPGQAGVTLADGGVISANFGNAGEGDGHGAWVRS